MKNHYLIFTTSLFLMLFSSCDLVEGIFKTGFWAGIIVVVLIIALIAWLIRKFMR
ncbi:MAG: hypothetical protein ACR2GN_06305 [Bacteroidia bacterium]